MYFAIPAARFYLRELNDVVSSKWGSRRASAHDAPAAARPAVMDRCGPTAALSTAPCVETAYVHCDSSRYGWGAVLNGRLEARSYGGQPDNQAVCNILAGLTSRSPKMMAELRKLLCLLDNNGVHMRARFMRSAVNVWADRLSRQYLDNDDWQLDPVLLAELEAMWGAHSAERFASAMIAMLPRYNVA
eukprot:jgi/Tetstr1/422408/TSEL_013246.t1